MRWENLNVPRFSLVPVFRVRAGCGIGLGCETFGTFCAREGEMEWWICHDDFKYVGCAMVFACPGAT